MRSTNTTHKQTTRINTSTTSQEQYKHNADTYETLDTKKRSANTQLTNKKQTTSDQQQHKSNNTTQHSHIKYKIQKEEAQTQHTNKHIQQDINNKPRALPQHIRHNLNTRCNIMSRRTKTRTQQ